ncbi:uncharacterized protein LOC113147263 [Cyclospora cayetanensis]|uniref:Uncharacterized protein LOC113147263 n=1 Tax=Cyclospora cayetanensis TaxID=88456 RepID=A0A6P6S054_9EIME|nr:uncharacterized protein LOC113147263 [Cyclospora cayetanensis]
MAPTVTSDSSDNFEAAASRTASESSSESSSRESSSEKLKVPSARDWTRLVGACRRTSWAERPQDAKAPAGRVGAAAAAVGQYGKGEPCSNRRPSSSAASTGSNRSRSSRSTAEYFLAAERLSDHTSLSSDSSRGASLEALDSEQGGVSPEGCTPERTSQAAPSFLPEASSISAAAAAFLPVPDAAHRFLTALTRRFSLRTDGQASGQPSGEELQAVGSQEGGAASKAGEPLLRIEPRRLPSDFFLDFPIGCLHSVFRFLLPEETLRVAGVCAVWREAVFGCYGAFAFATSIHLEGPWLRLGKRERQHALLQLQRLQHLKVPAAAFCQKGGLTLKEVAAVVARNCASLKTLSISSPESPLSDRSPAHRPFSLRPLSFPRLIVLCLLGSQTLEWLHVFCNCEFAHVQKLEVTYFPLPKDHWSWKVLPDFTALGVRGLQRILNQMPALQRFTLGFQVQSEIGPAGALDPPEGPFETAEQEPLEDVAIRVLPPLAGELGGPEPYGGRSRLRASRGQITEADLSDIFAVAYIRAGGAGNLKRIVFIQREPLQAPGGPPEALGDPQDDMGTIAEFVSGAASFCAWYVADVLERAPTIF